MEPRTPAQIAASRANGAKSRGPVTEAGKARSSQNARTHGFAADHVAAANENPAEWRRTLDEYIAHYHPNDPAERELVRQIAHAQYNLERLGSIETGLLDLEMTRMAGPLLQTQPDLPEHLRQALAWESLAGKGNALALLNRYQARHFSAFHRALKALTDRRKPVRQSNLSPLNRTSAALEFRRSLYPPPPPNEPTAPPVPPPGGHTIQSEPEP